MLYFTTTQKSQEYYFFFPKSLHVQTYSSELKIISKHAIYVVNIHLYTELEVS